MCMLVIGNGESRKNINLDQFTDTKVGCNALYRDYTVDHLICCDKRMVKEVQANNTFKGLLYTRKDWYTDFKGVECLPDLPYAGGARPDDPWHWGSGPFAVLIGARLAYEWDHPVNLIGFDLYSDTTVNNIYKGTQNYNKVDSRPVDPSYWIYQMGKVFQCFPKIQFNYYATEKWPDKYSNVSSLQLEELK
jgi:hypothetical protein